MGLSKVLFWVVGCGLVLAPALAMADPLPPLPIDCPSCAAAQAAAGPPMPGAYIPQCESDGSYSQPQCNGSLPACWCVDVCGDTIPGSYLWPTWQLGMPNCADFIEEVEPPIPPWEPTIKNVMDLVYCIVGLGSCAGLQPSGVSDTAGWSATVQDVMNMVFCLVGTSDCDGLQPSG